MKKYGSKQKCEQSKKDCNKPCAHNLPQDENKPKDMENCRNKLGKNC